MEQMNAVISNLTNLHSGGTKKYDLGVKSYAPGNWQYEWDRIATQATQENDHLAATIYHTVAAYPFINEDRLSVASYQKAISSYKKAAKQLGYQLEELTFNTQDGKAKAYLHLPANYQGQALPVMLVTNGSDHAMTQILSTYDKVYAKAGYAMISFDLPGLGSNGEMTMQADRTNVIHQSAIDYVKTDKRLNNDQVVLLSKSFGGNAAVRTAFTNPQDVAAVVSWCGAVNDPFLDLDHTVEVIEKMTLNALESRFDTDKAGLVAKGPELALSTEYLGKVKTPVPMLAINHTRDHVFPITDMRLVAKSSEQGEMIIIDENINQGHCSSEDKTLPEIIAWLDKTVINKRS